MKFISDYRAAALAVKPFVPRLAKDDNTPTLGGRLRLCQLYDGQR